MKNWELLGAIHLFCQYLYFLLPYLVGEEGPTESVPINWQKQGGNTQRHLGNTVNRQAGKMIGTAPIIITS
jgi:hypothetical protein